MMQKRLHHALAMLQESSKEAESFLEAIRCEREILEELFTEKPDRPAGD